MNTSFQFIDTWVFVHSVSVLTEVGRRLSFIRLCIQLSEAVGLAGMEQKQMRRLAIDFYTGTHDRSIDDCRICCIFVEATESFIA